MLFAYLPAKYIYNALNLRFKVNIYSITDAFQSKFYLISHDYFRKNIIYNLKKPRKNNKYNRKGLKLCFKRSKFPISLSRTCICNKILKFYILLFVPKYYNQQTDKSRKRSFILLKNIKTSILELEVSVLTLVTLLFVRNIPHWRFCHTEINLQVLLAVYL